MWVNEILPPRVRARWLLMTVRLSIISFAGIARTLVAVGICSEADMFLATVAAAPRNTCEETSVVAGAVGFFAVVFFEAVASLVGAGDFALAGALAASAFAAGAVAAFVVGAVVALD